MRVVLLNPPGRKAVRGLQMHTPNPPIGLAYVAAATRTAGHEVSVIDAVAEAPDQVTEDPSQPGFLVQGLTPPQLVERVPIDARVVGVTCMFSSQWLLAREIIRLVRRRVPEALIVCGGEHMSALPDVVLETSPADVVVVGEGEETFVELLAAVEAGLPLGEVAGLCLRETSRLSVAGQGRAGVRRTPARARRRQVDDIVWPAWDLLPLEAYIDRHQMHGVNRGRPMPVLGTRGCPYQCTFCSSPQMWTTRWIARDPESLLDEMEHYMARYGADDFHFQDLTAIVDRRWILDFTRAIERRGLRFTWQLPSGTRSEAIDAEVARALFRSGCRNLAYAPESGSDAIRKQVKKRVKIDAMLQSIRSTLAAGLSVSCFFVVGFPDDTDETLGETLALVGELARLGVHDVGVAKFSPYPGSRLFEELRASGRIALDDDYFLGLDAYASGDDAVSFCEALDARALHRWQLRILSRFYLRSGMHYPGRSATNIARVLTSGREETRYAKMIRDVVKTRTEWQQRRLKAAASRWSRSLLG